MGTRRKSSRPRRDRDAHLPRPETLASPAETRPRRDRDVCLPRPRRDRDVDNFSRDETETRHWYVSRPRRRDRDHNLQIGYKTNQIGLMFTTLTADNERRSTHLAL